MKSLIIRVRDVPGETEWAVDLCVETDAVDWRQKPHAVGSIPVSLPPIELPDRQGAASDIVACLLECPSPVGMVYQAIGRYLYSLLHDSGVGPAWDGLRKKHDAPVGEGLRTILDIEPPLLKEFPWEAVIDQDGLSQFSDPLNPWMRGPVDFDVVPDPYLIPLRILVVVGAPADNTLEWENEIEAIRIGIQAFKGKAEIKVLSGPAETELFDSHDKFQPHVFHFIGHGVKEVNGPGPALEFRRLSNAVPKKWELTSQRIFARLRTGTGRLAILNACRTDIAADSQERVLLNAQSWSLSQAFRRAGYGSVVAMQGDIPSAAAVAFTTTLYRQIGSGQPVDVAVAGARQKIGDGVAGAGGNALLHRDWVLPSLLVSHLPEHVLAPRFGVTDDELRLIDLADEFQQIGPFVDRTDRREEVWSLLKSTAGGGPKKLMVVHGNDHLGKTWLVWHVLRTCAWQGTAVRYVDLTSASSLNLLDVLRAIRDGSKPKEPSGSFISRGLPPAARDRLNHDLRDLRIGELPRSYDATQPVPEDDSDLWNPGARINVVCQSLLEALDIAAGEQPLILALDHLENVETSAQRQLADLFLRSVARGNSKHVRMIVVLQTSHYQEPWWPDNLSSMADVVKLTEINERFEPLAREFVQFYGYDPEAVEDVIGVVSGKYAGGPWPPRVLHVLQQMLELLPKAVSER